MDAKVDKETTKTAIQQLVTSEEPANNSNPIIMIVFSKEARLQHFVISFSYS